SDIKYLAEQDLLTFIRLIAPHRSLGAVHEELAAWWTREEALDNQLCLLPRDHQKSAMIAYRVAWWVTKHPDITVLYVSATADLAEKQLKFIKDILCSDTYRFYWPDMVDKNENFRERWAVNEISVDHPKRKAEGVRDPTVKAVGLTANTTGLHCNVAVLDDIVVPQNAYTQIGREQTRSFYSQLSSIETTNAKEWVVGTRYHPSDVYRDMIDMREYWYDSTTNEDVEQVVYEVFERQVEKNGEFLWPKQRRADGKTFGFDEQVLARKKAKYLDVTQFYAQYYNNPNSPENAYIDAGKFQYYNREALKNISGAWYLGDKLLNVYSAIDFAYSMKSTADYTVIMTVAVDSEGYIYILDIDRFRTNKISEMYTRIERCYRKWQFKRLRAEVTAAQSLVVQQLKDYMRSVNLPIIIEDNRPTRNKEERMRAALEPRYTNNQIWHYKGGNCQTLEEELVVEHPEHDDLKDSLAAVVEIVKPPAKARTSKTEHNVVYSSRFGGVAYS
ncbi:Terminase RNaseH-like domain containing protein, partial [uncultured Caudovirales phage]